MGLDFSHGDATWSYTGFMRFRERLAEAIGLDLHEMRGFRSPRGSGVSWDSVSDDIAILLNHSDCDDILTPVQTQRVAPRLRELVSPWPADDYDRVMGLQLANGMEEAALADEDFKFC